jgi:hypothetical protein
MMVKREVVELVTGEVYFSDDHWMTIWRHGRRRAFEVVGEAADRVRFIALVAHGGGRDGD